MLKTIGKLLKDRTFAVLLVSFTTGVSALLGFEMDNDLREALVNIVAAAGGLAAGKLMKQPQETDQ